MKKLTPLLAAAALLFGLSGKAQAVPMYYTFNGTVTSIADNVGAVSTAGLSVGSNVTYTFIVDFAADGARTLNDGTAYAYSDTAGYDYFYTDYVSGDALAQVGGGFNNQPYEIAESNVGFNGLTSAYGYLIGNSSDDLLQIYSNNTVVSNWVAGTSVIGSNVAYDPTRASSYLSANLTLTSIAPVAVPEPSMLLLLGSGMLGFFVFRRRGGSVDRRQL